MITADISGPDHRIGPGDEMFADNLEHYMGVGESAMRSSQPFAADTCPPVFGTEAPATPSPRVSNIGGGVYKGREPELNPVTLLPVPENRCALRRSRLICGV